MYGAVCGYTYILSPNMQSAILVASACPKALLEVF